MALFKRGQVWWMRFSYKGKQIRQSTETTDKNLAKRIYDKILGEIAEGKWFDRLPGDEKTFRDLMEKYLREHSERNKAPTSHRRDKSLADRLLLVFGNLRLSEISPRLIAEYKYRRKVEEAAPRTINYELALMSHAFSLAMKEWEWVKDNPVSRVSREKVNNQIERWLSTEEQKKLLSASPHWLKEIIVFAINTGFRQSEILNLAWPQVDLFRKTVTLLEQKNKCKDTLPLNQSALEVLKARAKIRAAKTDYVFYNGNGNRIDARNLLRAFYASIKKAEVEGLRFHDLRHTFATRLVQGGVDLFAVQKLGRWKTTSMVMRYGHHNPESLRPEVAVLDRFMGKSSTNLAQSEKAGLARKR
jgi:integrase